MKNIVIVENKKTIREGLKTLIDTSTSFKCIETFENYEKFEKQLFSINAHIILIDINLPGISGIEGVKKLKRISEKYIIIVLALHEENERIFEALQAGATTYLVKKTPPKKMLELIEDASSGEVIINSYIARKALNSFKEKRKINKLNDDEINVLNKLIEGNNLKAIEDSMSIKLSDIKKCFREIIKKLNSIYLLN